MKSWLWSLVLLCGYGFFKEMRPSEPYLTEYLVGPHVNLTQDEVYHKVYPLWTYSGLCLLPVIFLFTDICRYKPVLILEGAAYVTTWVMLVWGRGLFAMQMMQFVYAVATATEIAYYTYIYAKVEKEKYKTVTSMTRASFLMGQFISGFLSQILVSTKIMDYRSLNYVSLCSVSIAFAITFMLPRVRHSIYFHREEADAEKANGGKDLQQKKANWNVDGSLKKPPLPEVEEEGGYGAGGGVRKKNPFLLLAEDFRFAYSNARILRWSLWWAVATAGFLQVGNYIQPLWKTIQANADVVYNGLVEGISTLMGASASLLFSFLSVDWDVAGELCLCLSTFLQAGMLLMMAKAQQIWVCYVGYVVFRTSYQFMITAASYQVAQSLKSDSYGLIFGINTFVALVFGTVLTFLVYSAYFVVLAVIFMVFFCLSIRKHGKLSFCRSDHNTADLNRGSAAKLGAQETF